LFLGAAVVEIRRLAVFFGLYIEPESRRGFGTDRQISHVRRASTEVSAMEVSAMEVSAMEVFAQNARSSGNLS
jgi:hypothetical protein